MLPAKPFWSQKLLILTRATLPTRHRQRPDPVQHARYYWLLLAEGHLNRKLFGEMLGRIWALPVPGG